MTSIIKTAAIAALALLVATPAMAVTKGTKSYQSGKSDTQTEQTTAANEQPSDPTKIEPAAGAEASAENNTQAAPSSEGKSFKEEMRLPRKN